MIKKLFNILLGLVRFTRNKYSIDITKGKIYNQFLSKKLTNMFDSTTIDVYIINSNFPTVFTMPGSKYYKHPEVFEKIRNIKIFGPWIADISSSIENMVLSTENVKTLTPTVINKKIHIGLSNVNCYISSSLITILSMDEIFSVLLHEVGSNLTMFYRMLRGAGNITVRIIPFIQFTRIIHRIYKLVSDSNYKSPNFLLTSFCISAVGIFLSFLNLYFKNQQYKVADEFLQLIGYEETYNKARNKILTYSKILHKSTKQMDQEETDLLDKVQNVWDVLVNGNINLEDTRKGGDSPSLI